MRPRWGKRRTNRTRGPAGASPSPPRRPPLGIAPLFRRFGRLRVRKHPPAKPLFGAYLGVFRMRLIAGFQYRAAAWAGVATQFFWGYMSIMLYKAFYESAAAPPPMPFDQLVSFMWMRQAFMTIIMLWFQDMELLASISSGHIAYELARPYNLFALWSMRLIAQRLSACAMRCWPILLFAYFVPAPYGAQLPPSPAAFGLFLLSLSLALLLNVMISMYMYILTFAMLSPTGARLIVAVAADFCSGTTLPIPLMPGWLQSLMNFLPFRYAADVPLRIYSGGIAGAEAARSILTQAAWVVGLGSIAWLLIQKRIVRRMIVQGG